MLFAVHPVLIELHVKLLRRIHKKLSNVTADRWEKGVVKVRILPTICIGTRHKYTPGNILICKLTH